MSQEPDGPHAQRLPLERDTRPGAAIGLVNELIFDLECGPRPAIHSHYEDGRVYDCQIPTVRPCPNGVWFHNRARVIFPDYDKGSA